LHAQYKSGLPPTNLQAWQDLRKTGIDEDDIQIHAGVARSKGVADVRLRILQFPNHPRGTVTVRGLPDIDPAHWTQVDGTMPQSAADQAGRFTRGPVWSSNSCALDCFLTAALLAEGGRCQADQVDSGFLQEVAHIPEVIHVIRKPWSLLDPSAIRKLRNMIRDTLAEYNKKDFPRNKPATFSKIFEALGLAMPQFCATWSVWSRCCGNGIWHAYFEDGTMRADVSVGVHSGIMGVPHAMLSGLTVQDAVQACLAPRPVAQDHGNLSSCGAEGCSDTSGEVMPVVLDRPPPMLVLGKGFETLNGYQSGMFEELEIVFSTRGSTMSNTVRVRYELWGWIKHNRNHFTLYATRPNGEGVDYIYYDGMEKNGVFQQLDSLQDRLRTGEGVSCLIYKMVM
jgi:hypothetical protein